jgi:thiol:disulfide interchange protein DsbD
MLVAGGHPAPFGPKSMTSKRFQAVLRWAWAAAALISIGVGAAARGAGQDFLPPQQAFRYTLAAEPGAIVVRWTVAPGYYLYRKRLGVETSAPWATLGEPILPRGQTHTDEFFGEQEIYRGEFEVRVPLTLGRDVRGTPSLPLTLKLQGCADAGLCYPPARWQASLALPEVGARPDPAPIAGSAAAGDGLFARLRGAASRPGASGGAATNAFLPVDAAFPLTAVADGPDRIRVRFDTQPGYYLYRHRLGFATDAPGVTLGTPSMRRGEQKTDEFFGTQEVFHDELLIALPLARDGSRPLDLTLEVRFQGCADAGLCYPPEKRRLAVSLPAGTGSAAAGAEPGGFVSEQDRLAALIRDGRLPWVLATFFGLGLLLAFTPCVLPMVPILSGIIAGGGPGLTQRRAFLLSLTYVLGMAAMNTLAGIAAAAAGQQVQAAFQQPWIIVAFSALFVALALSMFGAFTLQVPAALQTRLSEASSRQRAGTFAGVAVMGALSALIVSACVAPPLFAALAVISQTGDVVRGGSALFAMSLGMGVPLLAIGTSAGRLLPRAGGWMETVKKLFGVLMLGVAVWMLARIVPERWTLLLWAVPAAAGAAVLWIAAGGARGAARWGMRGAGSLLAVWGLALLAGAALGGRDPLAPIPQLAGEHRELEFSRIKSLPDLEREVAAAAQAGRPVMLDFYADWCVSCKEMEKYTFTDAGVQAALAGAVLLQADVTANDAEDQALLKHFGIFGPPTIAFYGADGAERPAFRVVGFMKAPEFAQVVTQAFAAGPPAR